MRGYLKNQFLTKRQPTNNERYQIPGGLLCNNNIVFVNTNSVASIKAVVLLDVTGRSLILDNTTIDNNKALVDISNFSAGIYFIKLIMNNGTIFIEPVVRK